MMTPFNKTLLASAIATATLTAQLSFAETFNVTESSDDGLATTEQTLSWAIRQANLLAGADTIDLQTSVALSGVSFALIDSDITISGNNNSVSGESRYRPLFVKSGKVLLKDLTIKGGLAWGAGSEKGGSGAGLGGGLFIYGGDVTVKNAIFRDNHAKGGETSNSIAKRGGGGMQQTEASASGDRATSLFGNAEYGHNDTVASGNYGGGAGVPYVFGPPKVLATNGGFGGAGGFGGSGTSVNAGDGGFGGGGGFAEEGMTGAGGFGAGGASGSNYNNAGAVGGFGAGGSHSGSSDLNFKGAPGFGGSNADGGSGGNGAGMGGAIFVRSGILSIADTQFMRNEASRGGDANDDSALEAKGYGGAIFVLHTLENTNGNNQAMPTVLPTVLACDVTFGTEADSTANSADSDYNGSSNNDIFDPANKFSFDFFINNANVTELAIKQGESKDVSLSLDNNCDTTNSFTWSISQQAGKGTASLANATGTTQTLTFDAASDGIGSDSVIVSIADSNGVVKTQTVSFNIEKPSKSSSGGTLYWLLLLTPAWLRLRRKFRGVTAK